MNWLADNMGIVAGMCGVAAAGMIMGWIKTSNIRLLQGASLPLVLALGVLAVGWSHESPQAQVRKSLFATAEAIEQDKLDEVLDSLVPEAEEMRSRIGQALALFRISDVQIKSNLEITVSESGRRAKAEFNATALGSARNGMVKNHKGAFFFVVNYVRDKDRWLIDSFEDLSPEQGYQRPSARGRR